MAFNDKILIEKSTETRSTTGAVTVTWTTHVTCWSEIDQISGNEQFTSEMTVYNDFKRFKIHYAEGNTVTPKMRINYSGGKYYISSVAHEKRLTTVLTAMRNDDE